jgi:NADPH-dependent 2,4-dienoyl-CoA reductase/sulfur reductase-like enzyme/pSer/pThr/pTyr-binding forkhead associated (FHA) protein
VIIGDCAAGTTAADYLRRADPSGKITIFSEDPNPAYYRAALTNYLIGELREEQLFAVPPNFYGEYSIDRVHDRVVGIDTTGARVFLSRSGQVPYDRLLIASGASPSLPSFPGLELPGVMTMRTLQDARTVLEALGGKKISRAVVVGGGPLGLEWVQGLRARGVAVSYLLRGTALMESVLDRRASDLVLSRLRLSGVDVRVKEEIAEAQGNGDGRVHGVKLNSGDRIDCQLVGMAIGISPNVGLLDGSGVAVNHGVSVDDHLRTNVANIYAAGDVASVLDEFTGTRRGFGLWEPARLQARAAAINMAGGDEVYKTGAFYNATRLYDLDLASVGDTKQEPTDGDLVDFPRGGGRVVYRKLVVRDGRLVGALMLGPREEGVRRYGRHFKLLIELGVDISAVAGRIFDPGFDLAGWMRSFLPSPKAAGSGNRQAQRGLSTSFYVMSPSQLPSAPPNQPAASGTPSVSALKRRSKSLSEVLPAPRSPSAGPETEGAFASLLVQNNPTPRGLGAVTSIGRAPDNDVMLSDSLASSRHAEIRREHGDFLLFDLGSTNGTFLNDARVSTPAALRSGDVIRAGQTKLVFRSADSGADPAVAAIPLQRSEAKAPVTTPMALGYLEWNGQGVEVRGPVVALGRDPASAVRVADPAVSHLHAQIVEQEGLPYLRDLGSRNGTYVNAELVTVPHSLKDADLIHVGNTDIRFHARTEGARSPDRAPPRAGGAPPPGGQAPVSQDAAEKPKLDQGAAVVGPARLTVAEGPMVGLSFALGVGLMRAGRDPSNDLVIGDQTVSRFHASFERRGATLLVRDLGSANGTWVRGHRVVAGEAVALSAGDTVHLGSVVLRFEGGWGRDA